MTVLGRALGTDDVPRALWELAGRLGAPRSLAELGLTEADVAPAAARVAGEPYANPRPVTADGARAVLRAAYEGAPPEPVGKTL